MLPDGNWSHGPCGRVPGDAGLSVFCLWPQEQVQGGRAEGFSTPPHRGPRVLRAHTRSCARRTLGCFCHKPAQAGAKDPGSYVPLG